MQSLLPQGFMETNRPATLGKNKPNQTQFPRPQQIASLSEAAEYFFMVSGMSYWIERAKIYNSFLTSSG